MVNDQRLMIPSMKVSESLISFGVCGLRLCHLETKAQEEAGKTPEIISDLKSQVESFKHKLEVCHPPQNLRLPACIRAEMFVPCQTIKHLSWMGLFRDECPQQLSKFPPKVKVPQVNMEEEQREVRRKFLNMR